MPAFRDVVLSTAFINLVGCANVTKNNTPIPIFASPFEAQNMPEVASDSGKIECSMSAPKSSDSSIPSEVSQFSVLSYCAYTGNISTYQEAFVAKGISLADQTCGIFFRELEAKRTGSEYLQSSMNIAGSALTVILAASGSHARAVLNTATLLTASNAWFETYKSNFILTPELSKLQSKLQTDLKDPLAAQMNEKASKKGYTTFDDAKRDLLKYDELCSHQILYQIVSESVATAKLETFDSPPSTPSSPKLAKALARINAIYSAASNNAAGIYGPGEFESLYAIAVMAESRTERLAFAELLKEERPSLKSHIEELKLDGDMDPVILEKFEYAGELLGLARQEFVIRLVTTLRALAKINNDLESARQSLKRLTANEKAARLQRGDKSEPFTGRTSKPHEQTVVDNLAYNRKTLIDSFEKLLAAPPPILASAQRPISFKFRVNRSKD
ncbi:hypothetical protein O0881_08590 [Janthinobacterium sp. SUN100]|uniref:hypothetical protein n=1 Tax=Janthinobacterium sp. SUN100 TaxID=3004101 RepID=UPI0025B075E7|nr:hypothetical protein [Janthinobacterium sp. SUN100]MDN2702049.1 hypothetical protein [Janthinobacterium sp. SUN100]